MITDRYKHGKISFVPNDIYTGRALSLYGEREEIEVSFLCSLIKPGDTVIDVGANIGTLTIPMAAAVGTGGDIIAFEPQLEIFDLLRENIEINNLGNVVALNAAAAASDSAKLALPLIDYLAPGNFGGIALVSSGPVPVDVKTIDSLKLSRCDLIKIDVEGMEADVIAGAERTIADQHPLLYIENDRVERSSNLIELLHSLDYNLYWHTPPLFNPNNYNGCKEDVFPGVVAINMLCVPRGLSIDQTTQLRRVTGPFDRPEGTKLPASVKPPNGWAGVARFGGIGDNLMAASAVGALKRKGLKVEVITSSDACWQVFQHNPNIDKLSIKTKSEFPQDMLGWQKWFRGRADEYDVFAHLSHTCEGLLAFFPASTQFNWPAHVRRSLANKNYLEMVHDVAGVGYDFGPTFYSSDEERTKAVETKSRVGQRAIGYVLSGTRHDKLHPRTPGIIARLISEVGIPVVMFGSQERDFETSKVVMDHVIATNGSASGLHSAVSTRMNESGERAVEWSVRRTISFAQVCDLVIGPDTGVMWGVAFDAVPKIMLLSHASPENITKHWKNTLTLTADQRRVPCWPCHQLHDAPDTCTPNADNSGAACITDISVEAIIASARRMLQ